MGEIVRVFLYDELMNEEIFKGHGLDYKAKYSVTLSAHKRVFNKIPLDNQGIEGLGHTNTIPTHDSLGMMIGVMYEIDESSIEKLDAIYSHPDEYIRQVMEFQRHDFTPSKGYIYVASLDNASTIRYWISIIMLSITINI